MFPDKNRKIPFFEVREFTGGDHGDHGVAKKMFKKFMGEEFYFARDAKIMLERYEAAKLYCFQGRTLKIHPTVTYKAAEGDDWFTWIWDCRNSEWARRRRRMRNVAAAPWVDVKAELREWDEIKS